MYKSNSIILIKCCLLNSNVWTNLNFTNINNTIKSLSRIEAVIYSHYSFIKLVITNTRKDCHINVSLSRSIVRLCDEGLYSNYEIDILMGYLHQEDTFLTNMNVFRTPYGGKM